MYASGVDSKATIAVDIDRATLAAAGIQPGDSVSAELVDGGVLLRLAARAGDGDVPAALREIAARHSNTLDRLGR